MPPPDDRQIISSQPAAGDPGDRLSSLTTSRLFDSQDRPMSERISLLQHLTLAARAGHLDPALVTVVQQIGSASRQISAALARSALAGVLGAVETANASGETQKKLDVLANDAFMQALSWTGAVAGIASEELDGPYKVPGATGDYLVLLDPTEMLTSMFDEPSSGSSSTR
jgi:fructose-1,6-bisphosphatase I